MTPLAGDGLGGGGVDGVGAGGPAGVNAARCLEGARFPASRYDLLERARQSGAGQDLLEVLESLPEDREFQTLSDVVTACAQSDQTPQSGVIDIKP